MIKRSWLALLAFLAIALAACGSDQASSGETQAAPLSDKQAAQAIVLEVSDLPKGSSEAKKALVSESCNPVNYFQSYASAVADPFGFIVPDGEILQAVGVFENPSQARKAYDAITSKSARACVGAQMQKSIREVTGSGGELTFKPPRWTLPGETMRTMRLTVFSPFANAEVQRTAILRDRLLTSVTFISLNKSLDRELWESVSRRTAERVDEVASSIED